MLTFPFIPFQLRSSETSLHPSESGLLWTSVKADVKVTPELFLGGRLRVACLATVYDVYRSSANLDFFTPDTDPRPERSKCPLATNIIFLAVDTTTENMFFLFLFCEDCMVKVPEVANIIER